jgi:hypothetical protein
MADIQLLRDVVPQVEGWYCVVALYRGKIKSQSHYKTLEEVEAAADQLVAAGQDAFFGVGKFKTDENRTADNCGWMQSFFLDIDCGPTKAEPDERGRIKGYIDQATGFNALKELCKTLNLPRPTIVNSGRGWHVYWPLTEPVEREKWLDAAYTFKAQCLSHGFHIDPDVPADAARVLRIPGTKNFKDDPAHDVTLMHSAEPMSYDDFVDRIGPLQPRKKSHVPKQLDSFTKALMGNKQSRFKTILIKTENGTGCEQLKYIIENQHRADEPMWRAGLSIAQHCVDREKAVHFISEKHPGYDAGATEKKAAAIKGPYTCETFDDFSPNICPNCPHWGKIKSPIVLGHEIARSEPGEVIAGDAKFETAASSENTFVVPKLPGSYFRGKNGGIYKTVKSESEEDVDGAGFVLVYEYDLFITKRLYDPSYGETVLIRLSLPKDKVKEFSLTLVDALSKDELRKVLSFHGVIALPAQMNLILNYLVVCAKELQIEQELEMMRVQFGWAEEDSRFILGDREIGPSFVRYSPPSKVTHSVASALRPTGSLDEWRDIINTYNMPGFEPHAFAVFSAFGAPLLKFMGIKGSVINLINNRSGTGKSTILQVMNSVWGHPDELMLQWRDTLNVKLHRMAVMNNLPLGVDEITKMTGDEFSDLAYSVTQGTPRRRMKASANEERDVQGFWATIMVCTANASMTDKLEALKATSEGELMRLMQYKIDPTTNLDKREAKRIFSRLQSNYGLAGQPYAQYLVQNLEECVDNCMRVQKKFDEAVNIETRERFWSATVAANIAGSLIAGKQLGLHNINTKRVFDWVVEEVKTMQGAVRLSIEDYATIVGEFLLQHNLNILVVNKNSTSRNNIAAAPIVLPRGPLIVRYEPDSKRLYIIRQVLKEYCVLKQVTFVDLLTALNKTGAFLGEVRTRLDVGTEINAPPVVALEFDADLLGVAPAATTGNGD